MSAIPGTDVGTMTDLINDNGAQNPLITDQLLMAIFWEESLFNNIKQIGGSAIGFGQMEPTELKRMNGAGNIQVDVSRILADPATSVDATAQMLDALAWKLGKTEALRGYAGYYFKKDAAFRARRQLIITGWLSCENGLLEISQNVLDLVDAPDATIEALKKARPFNPGSPASPGRTWGQILFPGT
jgi:Transglycosylase SLT domain